MSVMDLSFLRFTPVPVRARRDGWAAMLPRRFIINLARGMGVAEAARALGRSRQSVYLLLDRPGSESFAAAWDAAVEFSCRIRSAPRPPAATTSGIETIWVPRTYRGRLVGYVVREDFKGAMRRLGQLDQFVDALGPPDPDEPDFEELLDLIERGGGAESDEIDAMKAGTPKLRQVSGRS
jgi:hypothetical protein